MPNERETTMDREERRADLSLLNPGRADPGYWERFRAAVLAAAAFELAARREKARGSVTAVLSAWSKRLIPATLAAAAAAALLVLSETRAGSDPAAVAPPLVLEDVLSDGSGDGPSWAAQEAAASPVAFMAFVEGQSR